MTTLLVIVIFVLLIVVHELGHFIVAKITRVKVEEFGVGYPPRAFLFGRWGGTEYTLNWIPFGGFVRLYGEDESGERGRGSLHDASRGVQAAILVAGVAMNALLAWALFASALHIGIPMAVDISVPGEETHLFVSDVVAGSPASVAGIVAGDEILGLKDPSGVELADLSPDAVLDFVRARGGKAIRVTYLHAGATTTADIRPANAIVPGAAGRPALGVGLALVANRSLPWGDAFVKAALLTRDYFLATVNGIWHLIASSFRGAADLQEVVGPVGLVSVVSEAAQNGLGNVLRLAGFISINLAVINLIPIPALDGGRLVVLAVEAAMRRSAPKLLVQFLNTVGIALIILLMVFVTYHDIARLLA